MEAKSWVTKLLKESESKEAEVQAAKAAINRFDATAFMPRHVKAGSTTKSLAEKRPRGALNELG